MAGNRRLISCRESDGSCYGTAFGGGASDDGQVFRLDVPLTARLQNILTRLDAETGDNVATGGFTITGGTRAKTIAIRGIGPSPINSGGGNNNGTGVAFVEVYNLQ